VRSHPLHGFTASTTVSLIDAAVKTWPSTSLAYGYPGERLPFSSRFSGNIDLEQDFPLRNNWTAFVGGAATYVGSREGGFTYGPGLPRTYYPSYGTGDLRAGIRRSEWTFNIFANNVTNRRGIIGGGGNSANNNYSVFYIQPLTVGLSATRSF